MLVKKRDGNLVDYNPLKVEIAMKKAFDATKTVIPDHSVFDKMLLRVAVESAKRAVDGTVSVEDIQDIVERVLMEAGYFEVGKSYILYRFQHSNIRNAAENVINYSDLVNGYLDRIDWRVKENSTVTYTNGGLILSNSGAVTANYWLNEIYDKEISDAHKNCLFHIHDLSMFTGYCAGWSLKQLIERGINGVTGKVSSGPPAHLQVLCNQMVNFLGILQGEWAGAQAFSSFDTYLAPFVRADNLSYRDVKKCIRSFVFGVNIPARWGSQAPFTNVTIDWKCPEDMKNLPAIVKGREQPYTYGDCQKEMDMINKAFLEVMIEGDSVGRGFQYPIPTYSITKDFDWSESENNRLLFEMTAKYGTPYFSNYVNSDMEPSDVRSMCCRLRLDLRELRRKNGGFFGSGESTGSVGVVTLNLPRLAYTSKNETEFFENLDKLMDLAARSLRIKREVITKLLNAGLYPYTKEYLGSFENHFSTIGICGGNEMCLNAKWLGKDLTDEASQKFCEKVLKHMRDRLSDYQEQYAPDLYNLEATPAESTSYRFARHDKEAFPDIITANESPYNSKAGETPYYTNSTNLPVGAVDDVFEALDVQDKLQPLYTSGTVFHTFLGEKLPTWESAAKLVKTICWNYKLPYITISPTYSVCKNHGYLVGEQFTCPHCGAETEVYSRITGYYRPVQNWNEGKVQEFKDRKVYDVTDVTGTFAGKKEEKEQETERNEGQQKDAGAGKEDAVDYTCTLVVTQHCPKCKEIKALLERAGIRYFTLNAENHVDEMRELKIFSAPALIIPSEPKEVVVGVPAIRERLHI